MKRISVLFAAVLAVLALAQLPAGATTTPVAGARQVAAGGNHTCARTAAGHVRCWGANSEGELGGGAPGTSPRAVEVQNPAGTGPLTGVLQVSAHYVGACALLTTREVVCWGANAEGQRGIGTTAPQGDEPTYVLDPAGTAHLTGVRSIATSSGDFVCAVLQNGQARCWGDNDDGQLGRGTTTNNQPFARAVRAVSGTGPLTGIASMDLGLGHACAALTSGEVRCWGNNLSGQLGDGTVTPRNRPVAVRKTAGPGHLANVASVGLGDDHSCAVLTSGQVRCWGANAHGALGDGTTHPRRRPAVVKNVAGTGPLTGVATVSAGVKHTCALTTSGLVRCWGKDDSGQLGNDIGGDTPRPGKVVTVSGPGQLSGVTSLTTGDQHACAVVSGGAVRCWGYDFYGQLGDDTTGTSRQRPVVVVRP
jgi:alpha-tubulin suppressor-like RCC1 family protein